ncbi:MAG: hypothetical protein JWN70_2372 [Planctomycetaceae bacterium]|nr:hypothetical protein [Planctomycetaceae bacterium]
MGTHVGRDTLYWESVTSNLKTVRLKPKLAGKDRTCWVMGRPPNLRANGTISKTCGRSVWTYRASGSTTLRIARMVPSTGTRPYPSTALGVPVRLCRSMPEAIPIPCCRRKTSTGPASTFSPAVTMSRAMTRATARGCLTSAPCSSIRYSKPLTCPKASC